MQNLDWYLKDAPSGSMTNYGFLQFSARVSPISAVTIRPLSRYEIDWGFDSFAASGSTESEAFFAGSPGTHAVVIGELHHFMLNSTAARADSRNTVLMLASRHAGGVGWHKTGMAAVTLGFTKDWRVEQILVGGLRRADMS